MLTGKFATVALLACTLVLGLYGIERSLWLDEAWVANSVNAPTLGGMFYYPNWLQTSPPLFLMLARTAVRVFGLSTVVLRSVPVLLSLLAVWAMLGAARRVVSPAFAVLATATLAFHPTVVEYFRSFKQYGGEVAATAAVLWAAVAYLQKPERKQFYILLGVTVAAMTLSYPTVFLLPGLIVVVGLAARGRSVVVRKTGDSQPVSALSRMLITNQLSGAKQAGCPRFSRRDDFYHGLPGDRRRAIALAVTSGVVLATLYCFLVRPNYTAALREYWMTDPEMWLAPGMIAAVAFCAVVAVRLAFHRDRVSILLLTPCVLLFASELLGWYPASPRTHLFVRPCFLLLVAMNLKDLVAFTKWRRGPVDTAVILATAVVMFLGVRKQFHEGRFQPEEDMSGAVRYLRKNVGPSDLVLVHPSLREGFLLYTSMQGEGQGWTAQPVIYADTGWPCCPRGRPPGPDVSTPDKIQHDLDAKIPRDFHGRIWLFYTDRPTHWAYVRVEDSKLWQNYFWSRDCRPEVYIRFPNLGLTPMSCAGNSP